MPDSEITPLPDRTVVRTGEQETWFHGHNEAAATVIACLHEQIDRLREAFRWAEAAIMDAVTLDDGLDGATAEAVLQQMRDEIGDKGSKPTCIREVERCHRTINKLQATEMLLKTEFDQRIDAAQTKMSGLETEVKRLRATLRE